jgi:glyoxylase-like metal-dependent hydrolase (beta-lactamase superfamily II)
LLEIETICLALPLGLGTVNAYLVHTGRGYVLIDTGSRNGRAELEGVLAGDLDLIVITHGDFDHTGNAAYLARTYGAPIAMHADDAGMAERGDMFWNRESGGALTRVLAPLLSSLFGFRRSERFTPDLAIEEGYDLSAHGLDARVCSLPGHSKGSIGVLTAGGDLFCGDLLANVDGPALSNIMDDPALAQASVDALRARSVDIQTVYPGHGDPFPMAMFWEQIDHASSLA